MGETNLLQQRRPDRRWPWLVAGTLCLAAGVAAWRATQISWASCAGAQSLWSSIMASWAPTVEWSEACYVQMDSGGYLYFPDQPAAVAAAVSMLMVAAAWLVLVAALHWAPLARTLAAGLGLVTLAQGLALLRPDLASTEALRGNLMVGVDIAALLVLAALIATRKREPLNFVRTIAAWLAVTSFGVVSLFLDFFAMITLSQANWDNPPGSGYLAALRLIAVGVILVVLTLVRVPPLLPAPATEQVEQVDAIA